MLNIEMSIMKIFLVYTSNYYDNRKLFKGFSVLEKAIDYATDIVLNKNKKYNRDYIRNQIFNNYNQPYSHDLFVYTDYFDMDYDEYVGIDEIEVEIS